MSVVCLSAYRESRGLPSPAFSPDEPEPAYPGFDRQIVACAECSVCCSDVTEICRTCGPSICEACHGPSHETVTPRFEETAPNTYRRVAKPSKPRKQRERCDASGLQFYPRLNLWKASNVTINPDTLEARSYQWWVMVQRFGSTVVLNSYRYSSMTSKHQWAARRWLSARGIDFIEVESPRGLHALDTAIDLYERRIETLEALISKPGTRKAKNAERRAEILEAKGMIKTVRQLIKVQSRKGGAA